MKKRSFDFSSLGTPLSDSRLAVNIAWWLLRSGAKAKNVWNHTSSHQRRHDFLQGSAHSLYEKWPHFL